ncbi:MAG: hypothetical protein AB8G17_17000 [Gammaproteobacteria bacterium]
MKVNYRIVLLMFCVMSIGAHGDQADIDTEIAGYIAVFKGDDFPQQKKAMSTMRWAGISDPALYDIIADKIKTKIAAGDKYSLQHASWFAKTLPYSGNEKYRPVLEELSASGPKKVRKHAAIALERFEKYVEWNPVIAAGLASAPSGRLEEARVKNMLAAPDPELLTMGMKRVYYGHKGDAELIELVAERVNQEYRDASDDHTVNAVAWGIKTLAESNNASYRSNLEEIQQNATNKKIVKYAKKYKDYL